MLCSEEVSGDHGSRTDTERRLAEIWEDLLGKPPGTIRTEDDFVNLGGDSLEASACLLSIEDAFGVVLSVRALIGEAPTLRSVAATIDSARAL